LLFLHGRSDFARSVYRRERRGYWAAAFPLALEKHGYLAVEEAGPEALSDPALWHRHGCAVIARLPESAWTAGAVEALVASGRPVLLEAPLPPGLRAAIGITAVKPMDREGLLTVTDASLAAAIAERGGPAGGRLKRPAKRPVPIEPHMAWQRIASVPIVSEQAEAWRAAGWDAERWQVTADVEVLAEWTPDPGGEPAPAIVRRGPLVACAVGLLSGVGQMHTAEPWEPGEFWSSPRIIGIEQVLLALVDEMHRQAGRVRVRLLPWPRGARWVMNVRYDFDRPLSSRQVSGLLERHDEVGTACTWYWRARHLGAGLPSIDLRRLRRRSPSGNGPPRLVARHPRHEVALHTEALWAGGERERRRLERVLGGPVAGTSAHGDPTCFRFQGAPNVLWAERQRLLYTELVQHAHAHPHRFAALEPDGEIRPLGVVCLPHHESFDLSTRPGDVATERLARMAHVFMALGGLMQVMNHPDIHEDELFSLLHDMPAQGRLDWTAREAADWWRRTHSREHLQMRLGDDGRVLVRSDAELRGAVVELLHPSGERRLRILDLTPDAEHTLDVVPAARFA
jgi:hypothetical protein